MSLDILIQHHPARRHRMSYLRHHVRKAQVITDPLPDDPPSPWRTYRRCLEAPARGSHRLILQDDALVGDGFREAAEEAVAEMPGVVISLFTGRFPQDSAIPVIQAAEAGLGWACPAIASYVPTVALVWPIPIMWDFLWFIEQAQWLTPMLADDEIVGRYAKITSVPVWHRVPPLVDHDDAEESLTSKPHIAVRGSAIPITTHPLIVNEW